MDGLCEINQTYICNYSFPFNLLLMIVIQRIIYGINIYMILSQKEITISLKVNTLDI